MQKNNLRIDVKGFESGSFHWCAATVQGAMSTTETHEEIILYRSKPWKRLLIEVVEFPSLKVFRCDPVKPALCESALSRELDLIISRIFPPHLQTFCDYECIALQCNETAKEVMTPLKSF